LDFDGHGVAYDPNDTTLAWLRPGAKTVPAIKYLEMTKRPDEAVILGSGGLATRDSQGALAFYGPGAPGRAPAAPGSAAGARSSRSCTDTARRISGD
jgi:hypothetical protein